MNRDPDYSAAYVILETDGPHDGHGLTFTIGRGNEICVAVVQALKPLVVGKTLESFTANLGDFWRMITGDSQLRWIGPEKGAIHMATAAVVNAVWDLYAKVAGLENRVIEYVNHLHEHFLDPVTMRNSHYLPPTRPGYSIQMKAQSLADHEFPGGKVWRA